MRWNHGGAGKEDVSFVRKSRSLPARARPHFSLSALFAFLATLLVATACDNGSEPNLVPAPEFRPCVDYGDHFPITSSVPLAGNPYDMLIAEGFLYVAHGNHVAI